MTLDHVNLRCRGCYAVTSTPPYCAACEPPAGRRCRQCGARYAGHPLGDGVTTCPGDFGPYPDGIVWEACDDGRRGRFDPDRVTMPMGMVVFDTLADRQAAEADLAAMGCRYLTTFRDAQGPGLSWAFRPGRGPLRPSAADRLPSVRRDRATARARQQLQGSLHRNPS